MDDNSDTNQNTLSRSPSKSNSTNKTIVHTHENSSKNSDSSEENQKTRVRNNNILDDRYELLNKIGEGGMGIVYRAKDKLFFEAKDKNHIIAVKVLGPGFKDHPSAFQTLQREFKKSRLLSHRNIVDVYQFHRELRTGELYMTMEYLEGITLKELIEEFPNGLPQDRAWSIILQIASALQYTHSKRIVHADFKPGNIFYTNSGVVKVFDFGVSRVLKKESIDTTLFDPGTLHAWSPPYASLETIQQMKPDTRDDIYPFALVAYMLLTGKHPFGYKSAIQARDSGLKPLRINNISRKNWNLIERGLKFERAIRLDSIDTFIKNVKSDKKLLFSTAIFLGISLSIFAMTYYFRQDIIVNVRGIIDTITNPTEKTKFNVSLKPGRTVKHGDTIDIITHVELNSDISSVQNIEVTMNIYSTKSYELLKIIRREHMRKNKIDSVFYHKFKFTVPRNFPDGIYPILLELYIDGKKSGQSKLNLQVIN